MTDNINVDTQGRTTTFADRLRQALRFNGMVDSKAQVAKLAEMAHITPKTAAKYLLTEKPPFSRKRPKIFSSLVSGLQCDYMWLYNGDGLDPWQLSVAKNMATMNKWQQNKMVRLSIRLLNNDVKVARLIKLRDEGFINVHQFLAAM